MSANSKVQDHCKEKQENGKGIFKCPFCLQRFSKTDIFKSHLYIHRPELKPPVAFHFVDDLKNESVNKPIKKKTTTNGKIVPYKPNKPVSQNPKPTPKSAEELLNDKETGTLQKVNGKYRCKICGKLFSKWNLYCHMLIHTGEKAYKCLLCEKMFRQLSHVQKHLRTVHNENPPISHLFTKRKKNCEIEKKTGKNKKYFCTLCRKNCQPYSAFVIHMRFHNGEKPFQCQLCDYKCVIKSDIKRHLKKHHKGSKGDCFTFTS